jgi:GDPmannose 4,6-dehydratase
MIRFLQIWDAVDIMVGDASRARKQFGWKPTVSFQEMVQIMVEADLKKLAHVAESFRS